MRRGFLNSKKVKAAPLYPEHAGKVRVIPKGLQGEGWSSSSSFFGITTSILLHRTL